MEALARRRFILLGFGTAFLTGAPPLVFPQTPAKPNFSGRWRMVRDRSEFHGFKMPDMVVRVVDHHDPILNLHTVQTAGGKTSMADVSYNTDGSPAANTISGREAQSKAFWDGRDLVIRTVMKNAKGDNEVIEDRWQLSADGQTLTTNSHVDTDRGGADLKLVCVKDK